MFERTEKCISARFEGIVAQYNNLGKSIDDIRNMNLAKGGCYPYELMYSPADDRHKDYFTTDNFVDDLKDIKECAEDLLSTINLLMNKLENE